MVLRSLAVRVLGVVGAAVTVAAAAGGLQSNHNETLVRDREGAD